MCGGTFGCLGTAVREITFKTIVTTSRTAVAMAVRAAADGSATATADPSATNSAAEDRKSDKIEGVTAVGLTGLVICFIFAVFLIVRRRERIRKKRVKDAVNKKPEIGLQDKPELDGHSKSVEESPGTASYELDNVVTVAELDSVIIKAELVGSYEAHGISELHSEAVNCSSQLRSY